MTELNGASRKKQLTGMGVAELCWPHRLKDENG
jgi:hypothetical protein